MEITLLKQYKGKTYLVELDSERTIYLHIDIIADFGLRTGMQIERDELKKIIYASNFHRAYEYSLYCLDYRDYSAQELYDKILGTYKSEKLCLAVIKKLAGAGIIDDRRYAEKLARRLVESRKYGYRRAKREILLKGVTEEIAEEALGRYDDIYRENLMELLEKKHYRFLTDRTDRKSIEKVKNALVRYGYGFDEINSAVREYFDNTEQQEG
ncbi:MAG: RecX family transcriptional regulator [Ruminococcus flavefaciens]|nr:RecX family transcriptional regulator [Ruminococcus flavefaciens]MCM1228760.1 RecX family transcriptional regulator [Ruminococcus flavefaciens]